jgi:hypothetical protein
MVLLLPVPQPRPVLPAVSMPVLLALIQRLPLWKPVLPPAMPRLPLRLRFVLLPRRVRPAMASEFMGQFVSHEP